MKYQGKVNGQNMQTFGEEAKGKDVETLEGIFWQKQVLEAKNGTHTETRNQADRSHPMNIKRLECSSDT